MRIFIEPTEALLFRNGRPFDAGQDNFAESLFPPTPETIQGAVRATIASYWDPSKNIADAFNDPESKLISYIGDRSSYGRFRITGFTLGRYAIKKPVEAEQSPPSTTKKTPEIERLFAPPAHIMNDGTRFNRLLPAALSEARLITNFPKEITHYLAPTEPTSEELKPLKGWITEEDLYKMLGTENLSDIKTIKQEDIYQEEPRLGIGIQRGTKATEEGYLYQTVMIRMNYNTKHPYRYGFVVDIQLAPHSSDDAPLDDTQTQSELHLPSSGLMTIGGEQRAAHFLVLPTPQKRTTSVTGKHSLLYLATPATFETGWKPSRRFEPLDKPITAAINSRYESIGGWKLNPGDAKGENKAMQRCVPAGSVYFFDERVVLPSALTDYGMEIGYGSIYEGVW